MKKERKSSQEMPGMNCSGTLVRGELPIYASLIR